MLLAREVGGQRHHRRVDRPRALDHAPGDDPVDVIRRSRDETARREQQQTDHDHRLAPVTVGQPPGRNLQDRLRQPVRTQRDTDQEMALPARQILGIQGKDRQDDEQAQHAQAIDARQANTGAAFEGGHCGI